MARIGLVLFIVCGCSAQPTPTPIVPDELTSWGQGAADMVWQHLRAGETPPLVPVRRERCADDYVIVFYDDPQDDGLLWAAGSLNEDPVGADGGFARNVAQLDGSRLEHGPCEAVFP